MSRLNKERLGEMMRLEIAGSRFKLNDAQTRIRLTESALEQAKENLRVSEDQYEVGMENLTNLLEAHANGNRLGANGWRDKAGFEVV